MAFSLKFWKNRKRKPQRQKWKPNILVRLWQLLWCTASSAVKIAVGAVATVALIVVLCVLVFAGILAGYLQEDILPDSDYMLGTNALEQTSFLYNLDSNGQIELLRQIYTTTDREWASLSEIPLNLQHAAVAIEDKRFYEHQGVDWITTAKASIKMFFGNGGAGGSTITQQLIKNDSGEDGITVRRKVREIFRATALEKNVTKDTIMEWYLNLIFLGEGCYGVKTAADEYFGKELADLTIAECASLVSITNNPSIYDPYSTVVNSKGEDGAARNRNRYENVLNEMLDQGWITEEEHKEAWEQELVFKRGIDKVYVCSSCGYQGPVSEFIKNKSQYDCPLCGSEAVAEDVANGTEFYTWFEEAVMEDVAEDLAAHFGMAWNDETRRLMMQDLRTGGYHIYTTLDPEVQKLVDDIYEDLDEIPEPYSKEQLQSGIVVVDNTTGDIVALSGGVGKKDGFDYWCRATDATLQTGSSIKPLTVYAPAFEAGLITPATIIDDIPLNYDDDPDGYPTNADYVYTGATTIYMGVTRSINTVACHVLSQLTPRFSFNYATENFHLNLLEEQIHDNGTVSTDIGIAPLGMGALSYGLTVEEMTVAFATFANGGVYREGRLYTKVYDSDGNLILDNQQETHRALSEKATVYMTYCLENAVNAGTGGGAQMYDIDAAGKTGSTSSYRDRWFVGFTHYYTCGVWCGFDTPEPIRGLSYNPAARLWSKVMKPLHSDLPNRSLYSTSGMRYYDICMDCGKLATEACKHEIRGERVIEILLYREDSPDDKCTCHAELEYCVEGKGVCNEYCKLFAEHAEELKLPKPVIEKKSLWIVEKERFDAYVKAEVEDLDNSFIFLVDEKGNPLHFTGIKDDINKTMPEDGSVIPYVICTLHTKEAWEAAQPAPTDPTGPVDPSAPTDPNAPTNPNAPTDPNAPTTPSVPTDPGATTPPTTQPSVTGNQWWE